MSTRVFKPIGLSEVPRLSMRSSLSLVDDRLFNKGLPKVRRALFHPDPEGTRKFLRDEFAKLAASDRDKWDFDFVQGQPRSVNGRYEWVAVVERTRTDVEMAPAKRLGEAEDATGPCYAPIESSSGSCLEDEPPAPQEAAVAPLLPKKQSLITDFMQARKRIEERPLKKLDPTSPMLPQKKARMSLVDSAS